MAFFYDTDEEELNLDVGLPIVLEPDDDYSLKSPPFHRTHDDPFHDNSRMALPPRDNPKKDLQVPTHPIPSMQEAFAESMLEVATGATPPKLDSKINNAVARRKQLLDQDVNEETHAGRWKRRPGQKYHELWKLMAQISFGIYLLLNGIAKDEDQVMNILQGHVDEVDEFLETTLEDFELAQDDIEERLKFLKLPLENIEIFDTMLEDRNFRYQIVNGNERIEHVITRTAAAMNDSLKNVQQGMDACKEFTIYLAEEQGESMWKEERANMRKVFDAMKGNVEGWCKAYVSLQTKGNHLAPALVQLETIVAEMDRRAGEVSRKQRFSTAMPSPPGSPPNIALQSRVPSSPPSGNGLPPNQTSPPISVNRHLRKASLELRRSMGTEVSSDSNHSIPPIRAALPAFQQVDKRERTPEREPAPTELRAVEEAAPEPDFILKPHTYSPSPSPKPPGVTKPSLPSPQPSTLQQPILQQQPSPELGKRASLRQRFSLKRKETPSEITIKAPAQSEYPEDNYWGPRQRVKSATTAPLSQELEAPVTTPPSRGLDSAYCSDFEKPTLVNVQHPATLTANRFPQPPSATPTTNYPHQSPSPSTSFPTPTSTHFASPRIPPRAPNRVLDAPPQSIITRDFVPSPRSDRQFFRPVNASPHSPLQRPWTAAPSNIMHIHSNSSSSNLKYGHTHTPSQLGNRNGAPSAMGMSMMSDMTTVTEGGKKIKKKRSAFGWLKKAFSLSEEEKAAFEERRRMTDDEYRAGYHEKNQQQKWLDGKRVR